MMAEVPTRRSPVRLTFKDGEVMVTPKDRDIFFISAETATEACRDAVRHGERFKRFESEFLAVLHDWCLQNQEKVRACYIPRPGVNIPVFIVTTSPEFDFDLAGEIAALELKLVSTGWRVGLSQLPDADDQSLATFFNPDGALEVYADRGSTSEKGGKQPQVS